MASKIGSLVVVGTGIRAIAQMTQEAIAHIEMADKLYYLVCDPLTAQWLSDVNKTAESLYRLYKTGTPRRDTYLEMVRIIVDAAVSGKRVCAAFYGHPGVFAFPTHEALRQVRSRGLPAQMLPGISAEDCLFADLGVDPGTAGCQSFEATDFLARHRTFDSYSSLILWQIAVIGEVSMPVQACNRRGLTYLTRRLIGSYAEDHEVTLYEAAQFSVCEPSISRLRLGELAQANVLPLSTLYVPPRTQRTVDPDVLRDILPGGEHVG